MRFLQTCALLVAFLFTLAACSSAPSSSADAPVDANPPVVMDATDQPTSVDIEETETSTDAAPTTGEVMSTEQTSGGLPLYAAATALEDNAILSTMINTMKEQLAQQQTDATVHVDAYGLAGDANFADVKEFYNSYLTGEGWTELTDAAQIQQGVESAGWTKDANSAVVVMVMPDPMNSANKILIISQAEN
jgi:hypothetical protein